MPIIIPYGPPAKTRIVCVVRFLNSSFMEQYLHTNTSKYGGTVYTINGHVNRDKLNDRSHHSYFMGYAANTGVILYWNTYQPFVIHRYYHVLFDEHNSLISIEDKHIPYYLLLQQDPESIIHNSDLLKFILRELDLTSTQLCDTTILTYEIELPPDGRKIGINLLDDEDFTIPYVTNTIPY